jgi:hypothetical protein
MEGKPWHVPVVNTTMAGAIEEYVYFYPAAIVRYMSG